MPNANLKNIPTHIFMGFLGCGKTTAILNLFAQKPAGEKWAVLVNEFGDAGIDGKIYASQGITVEEIPGGCMCCAQGVPMRVAINRLLRESRPQRLLIESSGVGHASGLLKTLSGPEFQGVLDLKATIALLDPEKLLDTRLRDNALFQDQLNTADIIVANKIDKASPAALAALESLCQHYRAHTHLCTRADHGQFDINYLQLPHRQWQAQSFIPIGEDLADTCTVAPTNTQWQTHTLRYPANTVFQRSCLDHFIKQYPQHRIKGFLNTDSGPTLINAEGGDPGYIEIPDIQQSYLEIIGEHLDRDTLTEALEACKASA